MRSWLHLGYRAARRVVVGVVGGTIVALGVVMVVLPGPALLVIPIGLAILGLEFAWARRWLRRLKAAAETAARFGNGRMGSARSGGDQGPRAGNGGPRSGDDGDRPPASMRR